MNPFLAWTIRFSGLAVAITSFNLAFQTTEYNLLYIIFFLMGCFTATTPNINKQVNIQTTQPTNKKANNKSFEEQLLNTDPTKRRELIKTANS